MFYAIRHFTRYRYSSPVSQSVMEIRMHPRNEATQRCFTFQLSVSPRARVFSYRDQFGNTVHHFDIPPHHPQLTIVADSLVDVEPANEHMPEGIGFQAWSELEQLIEREDYWDMLSPSRFARPSRQLEEFARAVNIAERGQRDPLELLRFINSTLYSALGYEKRTTHVNSPIEDALNAGSGVCQDFAHIMTAIVRELRIPCRYVSGYLHHSADNCDRSSDGATHAWVEALVPGYGWVGFDPTNNLVADGRHIRTAIGRDYADVPPTVGTMKGSADSELLVRVRVTPSEAVLPPEEEFAADEEWSLFLARDHEQEELEHEVQQQQQ